MWWSLFAGIILIFMCIYKCLTTLHLCVLRNGFPCKPEMLQHPSNLYKVITIDSFRQLPVGGLSILLSKRRQLHEAQWWQHATTTSFTITHHYITTTWMHRCIWLRFDNVQFPLAQTLHVDNIHTYRLSFPIIRIKQIDGRGRNRFFLLLW